MKHPWVDGDCGRADSEIRCLMELVGGMQRDFRLIYNYIKNPKMDGSNQSKALYMLHKHSAMPLMQDPFPKK